MSDGWLELASAPASVVAAPPAAIVAALRLGTGLGNRDGPIVYGFAIDLADGLLGRLVTRHLDKGKAFGPASDAVGDDGHTGYLTGWPEQFTQRRLGDAVRQVANIQLLTHGNLLVSDVQCA